MFTPNTAQRSLRRTMVAYSILVIGLVVSARLILGGLPIGRLAQPGSAERDQVSIASAQLTALDSQQGSPEKQSTRPIESIRVGDRVLAQNPEIDDRQRAQWQEPNWEDWLHLSLKMPLDDDLESEHPSILDIEILRPSRWLIETANFVYEDQISDLKTGTIEERYWIDRAGESENVEDRLVGLAIDLDLPEMGAVGTAYVSSIAPCPQFMPGQGQVVTATFSHPPSSTVVDVTFEGDPTPIGVTDNHPFWSADRQAFLAIGQFQIGEWVLTYHGDTKRLESRLPRPGPQVVYNLEIYGEHVYFVGHQALLVHNSYGSGRTRGAPHRALNSGDVDQYRYFAAKSRRGDGFDGHELWQNANNESKFIVGGGRTGTYGKMNPSMALSEADHKIVNNLQGSMIPNAAGQTPLENITANIRVLRQAQQQGANITDRQIKEFASRAVRFYQRMAAEGRLK